jgi:hypothetical protein
MNANFDPHLLDRDFGSSTLHIPSLRVWMTKKGFTIDERAMKSDRDFIPIEALLNAVGVLAVDGVDHELASKIVANDGAPAGRVRRERRQRGNQGYAFWEISRLHCRKGGNFDWSASHD